MHWKNLIFLREVPNIQHTGELRYLRYLRLTSTYDALSRLATTSHFFYMSAQKAVTQWLDDREAAGSNRTGITWKRCHLLYRTLTVSFGGNAKSLWPLLFDQCLCRGSKRSHTGSKCVTCRGINVRYDNNVYTTVIKKRVKVKAVATLPRVTSTQQIGSSLRVRPLLPHSCSCCWQYNMRPVKTKFTSLRSHGSMSTMIWRQQSHIYVSLYLSYCNSYSRQAVFIEHVLYCKIMFYIAK